MQAADEFPWSTNEHTCAHVYLLPPVEKIIAERQPARILDLGCGNGAVANRLSKYAPVTGIDSSESGIRIAKQSFPHLNVKVGSVYDDLAAQYGTFPIVVSLEVVEHLYDPRTYAKRLCALVEPTGIAVISTPYHGYWKNLTLALTGKLDAHFSALWDAGHIKFWSIDTLGTLLKEAGFCGVEFIKVGRIAPLAKSMIAVAKRSPS